MKLLLQNQAGSPSCIIIPFHFHSTVLINFQSLPAHDYTAMHFSFIFQMALIQLIKGFYVSIFS